DGETRPCRSGNCAPTSLTLRGAQMDLGPPGSFKQSFTGHVTLVCQVKSMAIVATSIGSTITNVLNSAGNFFSQLSDLGWGSLLIALALYAVYLLLRSRA